VLLSIIIPATNMKVASFGQDQDASGLNFWKVIRDESGRVEIYDLLADPNKTRPLGADVAGEGVTSGLGAFLDVVRSKKTGRASELPDDPAVRAQLRALGYVE